MRELLKKRFLKGNPRMQYKAYFERFGKRYYKDKEIPTILLRDVVDSSNHKLITDHLWLDLGKRFQVKKLEQGDPIRFYARVKEYTKGYGDDISFDYGLSYPSQVCKLRIHFTPKPNYI